MKLRLFPVVLFAATSLLSLKAFDMIFSGEQLLSSSQQALASDEPKTAAQEASKEAPKEAAHKEKEGSLLAPSPRERPKENIVTPKDSASAQTALDERLGDKRLALEERNKELDLRESLVNAAEKRLDEKIAEMKKLEGKASAESDDGGAGGLKIKNLVIMYETMKIKSAAEIFNSLDMDVMIEVVSRMKPQVTSQILAAMTPESAQKLTVEMARRSLEPLAAKASIGANGSRVKAVKSPKELPRIDNPAPKQS